MNLSVGAGGGLEGESSTLASASDRLSLGAGGSSNLNLNFSPALVSILLHRQLNVCFGLDSAAGNQIPGVCFGGFTTDGYF